MSWAQGVARHHPVRDQKPIRPHRQPYPLKAALEAATAAAKTDTFWGERYRRLRRQGKPKALVAVARSIPSASGTSSPIPPPATTTSALTSTTTTGPEPSNVTYRN